MKATCKHELAISQIHKKRRNELDSLLSKVESDLASPKALRAAVKLWEGHSHLLGVLFETTGESIQLRPTIASDLGRLSHGEQILCRIAIDFWSGNGRVLITEIFETLDASNLNRFILATCYLKRICIPAGQSVMSETSSAAVLSGFEDFDER